ncbi:DUF4259 domain-containing protein [Actinacidiphila acididurans]|uniref:DUF4259 domain-containing protein n=1 Tax=Actinacidiphila acididurans TaxID=2784346 RepID=A0ABS2TL39_9ACTN|nr:DUF4259 domain-containing protein [Actinacidiphila acididurans]MBM9504047.1 DUF4259 domain-containing protein [Actinacidiphila acididurans]
MGTWGTGPFDNDTAADFANALDDAEPDARESLIRGVLVRTVDRIGYLVEADEAVAAAALIAAQCPGGEPVDTPYGPEKPLPTFPTDLRTLADEALARIAGDEAGPASNWVDPEDWKQWQAMLTRLRGVLAPPPSSLRLFDIEP